MKRGEPISIQFITGIINKATSRILTRQRTRLPPRNAGPSFAVTYRSVGASPWVGVEKEPWCPYCRPGSSESSAPGSGLGTWGSLVGFRSSAPSNAGRGRDLPRGKMKFGRPASAPWASEPPTYSAKMGVAGIEPN